MGLLDGDIRSLFGAAFSGIYLDGSLHAGTREPVYAPDGTITGYTGGDRAIKVQTDRVGGAEKSAEGYQPGDVNLIVLAGDGSWRIDTDMQVTDGHGDRYRVSDVDQDAARSHWICRGSPV